MLKRELKINFKSFFLWTVILISLFLIVFLVYPYIINSGNIELMNEMMEMFPKELLKAFNMDISSLDSAFGWLKSEGFIFILLITGVYASLLGSNVLIKEENDKTIEYLNTLPVTRKKILFDKIICSIIYIVFMIIIIGVFNFIALELSGDFDRKQYLLLSITPVLTSLPLFAINLFISSFTHKTKKTFGLSLGISLISYFILVLSEMDESIKFFKYFTLYTLADIRNVIINISINPIIIIISLLITIVFLVATFIRQEKRELL